jgi:predicted O-methyltransferase YrrM
MKAKLAVAKLPILGPLLLFGYRLSLALRSLAGPLKRAFVWSFRGREITNFTYHLEPTNRLYLASLLADITGQPRERILGYFEELEQDSELAEHVAGLVASSERAFVSEREVRYGRRLGWYALVRAAEPAVVVETGVDKGLGACVLTAALRRNAAEGVRGRYYGTDINPDAGFLLRGPYAEVGEVLYGDSVESLRKLDATIDLFINDSEHSAAYEAEEYQTVAPKLSDGAVILGDNAHVTDRLLRFAEATGRSFVFFREQPRDHWYPGAGIGIAFRRR